MTKIKPKALVCDLDGTLISSFIFRLVNHNFWWSFGSDSGGGILSFLPASLQIFFLKPTDGLKRAQKYQSQGIKLVILTAKKKTRMSQNNLKCLFRILKIEPDEIFLRPPSTSVRRHKEISIRKIKEKYTIIGIMEDEERFHSDLKKFGPILNHRQ